MSRTILVVDDEVEIGEAIALILEDEGYRVFTAANGREGLARLRDVQPDLVFLDVMMPQLTGTEVLREIRADPVFAKLPVALMSAARAPGTSEELGYDAFVPKPFALESLLETAVELLEKNAPDR